MKLGAITLFVEDMKTMVEFYRDVIGMEIEWDGSGFTGAKLEGTIHNFLLCEKKLFKGSIDTIANDKKGLNGRFELCFDLDTYAHVDKEYQRLLKAGAKSIYEPTTEPYGMRVAYIADPEGNLIEICSGVE